MAFTSNIAAAAAVVVVSGVSNPTAVQSASTTVMAGTFLPGTIDNANQIGFSNADSQGHHDWVVE